MIARMDGVAKNVTVTDKVTLKVEAPKGECEEIGKLIQFANCSVSVYVVPKQKKENYLGDKGQLDFVIHCPKCKSYDCIVGEFLAGCENCGIEFKKEKEECQLEIIDNDDFKSLVEAYQAAEVRGNLIVYLTSLLDRDVSRATHITKEEWITVMSELTGDEPPVDDEFDEKTKEVPF